MDGSVPRLRTMMSKSSSLLEPRFLRCAFLDRYKPNRTLPTHSARLQDPRSEIGTPTLGRWARKRPPPRPGAEGGGPGAVDDPQCPIPRLDSSSTCHGARLGMGRCCPPRRKVPTPSAAYRVGHQARGDVALGKEAVFGGLRVDMPHAPLIAEDLDGLPQTGKGYLIAAKAGRQRRKRRGFMGRTGVGLIGSMHDIR